MAANGQDSWRPAPVPETNSLAKVAAAAKECTACPLYKKATQTVFGEGPKQATMLMIGEQPGDYEDVRGKRRIHQKPSSRDIAACRPWLEAELRLIEPKLVVCLGSTAGQTVFGPGFRVTKERGKLLSSRLAPKVMATVHPSSLLRQPDEESREREYNRFVADLRIAVKAANAK